MFLRASKGHHFSHSRGPWHWMAPKISGFDMLKQHPAWCAWILCHDSDSTALRSSEVKRRDAIQEIWWVMSGCVRSSTSLVPWALWELIWFIMTKVATGASLQLMPWEYLPCKSTTDLQCRSLRYRCLLGPGTLPYCRG